MPICDFIFRVHGDCIRAGYSYPLLGALKFCDEKLASDSRLYLGLVENVRPFGSGYLGIKSNTVWRVRAPSELTARIARLCGVKLLIGDHVVRLGELKKQLLVSGTSIYAEFITFKSKRFSNGDRYPGHREFLGFTIDKLRRKYGLTNGKVEVGRRRLLRIGPYVASIGYALGIYGIDKGVALDIMKSGLGGRRHMGASMFLPGMLPQWVRVEKKLFNLAP